jgi:lysophospholipase L1-like esterase
LHTSSRTRPFARIALAALPIALLGGIAAAPAHASVAADVAADAAEAGDHRAAYVALGDSYASGFGLEPYSKLPVPGCFQSEIDYPHRVADALDLRLTDVTCAGALAENVTDTPQQTARDIFAPPQSDALSKRTKVVTLTIGGNDLGFSSTLPQCIAASGQGPLLGDQTVANCESVFVRDGFDALAARLEHEVLPAVERSLAAIAEKAPNADVVIVGYPTIFPGAEHTPAGGCFVSPFGGTESFPFTDVDTAYFHRLQVALDEGVARLAEQRGATFVSSLDDTAANSPCAGNPDAWVSGLTFTAFSPAPVIKDGGLHPNEAGVAFLAEQTTAAISGK